MIRRALTRLRERGLWWRHTWTFQFAHGPLCDRHRAGAVRLGAAHVCRSCLALHLAWIVALPVLLGVAPGPRTLAGWLIGVSAAVLPLSWPPLYGRLPRLGRDALRAGAGVLVALTLTAWIQRAWTVAGTASVVLGVGFLAYARARRQARPHICAGCPELGQPGVCSGYALQAQALRAYEEAASAQAMAAWVRSGGPPGRAAITSAPSRTPRPARTPAVD